MYRLIYKSTSPGPITKENLRDILFTSLNQNRAGGINGALLTTHSHFLQFLEGDFEAVNETFFRIAKDPRHVDIKLVSFGPVEKAIFSEWNMKGFGVFDLNLELENRLKQKYGEEENGVFLPIEETQALSLLYDIEILKKT
jgi:hypothetical protein